MSMQSMSGAPARNPSRAASASGKVVPGEVKAGAGAIPANQLAKNNSQNGPVAGPASKGFAGKVIEGKIKC